MSTRVKFPREVNELVLIADTAYVRSSGQWMYAEDSRVTPAREVDVMVSNDTMAFANKQSRPAYILFYKRVPPQ